jgi:hypothetical protein
MYWAFVILAVVTGIWGVFAGNEADSVSNGPTEGADGSLAFSALLGAGIGLWLAIIAGAWLPILIGAVVGAGAFAQGFLCSGLLKKCV